MTSSGTTERWVPTIALADLVKKRRLVVTTEAGEILLIWHDERPYALASICIHQDRELARGNILSGRLICPGHQWAFDLGTGLCKERERSQPAFATRVDDGTIHVNVSSASSS